jgi:hypothetical protein
MIKLILYLLQIAFGNNKQSAKPKQEKGSSNNPEKPSTSNPEPSKKEEIKPEPKVFITLNDWITSSNKYPDRAKSPELTESVKANAIETLRRVNALLNDLNWSEPVIISSGFRPSDANASIGGAKKSAHLNGEGLDIVDVGNKLKNLILDNHELLKKHGLWMEDKSATPTWCHLDTKQRSPRAINVFKP